MSALSDEGSQSPVSPVGVTNVGYEITAAVRMHSEGVCDWTREDYWIVLGHNPAKSEMVCWYCRWQENYGWAFSHGTYVSGVRESFLARIGDELPKMVSRTESLMEVSEDE